MRKFTLLLSGFLLALTGLNAQTSCSDRNGYVDLKNTGGTGAYTLQTGQEEKAAQTYHYSVPGKITSVRVYGNYPGIGGGVPLRVSITDVDANGRPTTTLQSTNTTWWWTDNFNGYITVGFPSGGVNVSGNFAVTVELRFASPWGNTFQLQYTGNGEGAGEDLASLAGTSTGNNWTSAMTAFNKDGDFYLEPRMTNYISSSFTPSTTCIATNTVMSFANTSSLTMDPMFNTIALPNYSGNTSYYDWDFGDGTPVSHVANPTHSYATAGSYIVTLTCNIDGWNNDCSVSSSKVISVGLASSATSVAVNCFGSSSGSVTLTGSGGITPYTFSLNQSAYQSSGVFNNLPAGNYTGTVMDNNGCLSTASVTITQPAAIVIQNVSSTNSSCGSANGALLVNASGGTGALQYQLNTNPYQSSNQFNNLLSDFYQINVKDANGCVVSGTGEVNDQGAPTLQITSQTNVSCHGGNNGTIVMIGTGGSGTLQYSIN
ncbi:MAG TPA: PKD domain-containing protein, partial [Bacteroidia bacterium]|nr:PKD domain-containing protein [Bacteroidia bacterium]